MLNEDGAEREAADGVGPTVFVSYSRTDRKAVLPVVSALEQAGYAVWWDQLIEGGERYLKTTEAALEGAKAVVVLWSNSSVGSHWVNDEAMRGRDRNCLVPLTIDGAEPPLGFRQFQTIDLSRPGRKNKEAGLSAMLRAVGALHGTIPKAGYRPIVAQSSLPKMPLRSTTPSTWAGKIDRRIVLGGAASLGLGALGVYWWIGAATRPDGPAVELYRKARDTQGQALPETTLQAVAYFREAVRIDPQYAEAWGALALAYRGLLEFGDRPDSAQVAAWSRSAARRALELDPSNVDAHVALVLIKPFFRNWASVEADCRRLLRSYPRRPVLIFNLAWLLHDVGRSREAADMLAELGEDQPFWPLTRYMVIRTLWSAGRLDEAQAASDDAIRRWPGHPLIWQVRVVFLMHSGRAAAALAFAGESTPPTGYRSDVFEPLLATARALSLRSEAAADEAVAMNLALVGRQPWAASAAAVACAALGRNEESFALLEGYFLGRGRWAQAGPPPTALARRYAAVLFEPPLSRLRQETRFAGLLEEIGLESYWRSTDMMPDYRIG